MFCMLESLLDVTCVSILFCCIVILDVVSAFKLELVLVLVRELELELELVLVLECDCILSYCVLDLGVTCCVIIVLGVIILFS